MVIDDPKTWPPPYRGRGANFDPNDKRSSPVIGYRSMSHWTKDLTCMRYAVPTWVMLGTWSEKMERTFAITLDLIEKTDKHRPYWFLIRLMRRLLEEGMTVRQLGVLFGRTSIKAVTHHMGRTINLEVKHRDKNA